MKKINLFDLAILVILVGAIALGVFAFTRKPQITGKDTILKVTVTNPEKAELLYNAAIKQESVYFNSTNEPVKTVKVEKLANSKNELVGLNIYLEAKGEVGNRYVFNGTRVLVGQKGEIHSTYVAKGVITEVKYAE